MTINEYILNISNNSKIVKEIAQIVKNSKGTPAEITAKIANDYNLELPKNLNLEFHTASDDVFYFIIPADLSDSIEGIEDSIVAAGHTRVRPFSMGTASTMSTVLCASCSTSFFSASTAASGSCVSTFGGFKDNIPD